MLVQTQWSSISLSAAEITVFWFVCSHLPYWSSSPSRPPKFFLLFSILVMRVDALHNCTQHHQQQQQGMMELHGV
jgi:hypothetical protein